MSIFDLWAKATARSICRDRDCRDCKYMYDRDGFFGCPDDVDVSNDEMSAFVQRVSYKLRERMNEDPVGITEDEFVNILMECER